MKKILRRTAVAMAILCMGGMTTSCENDTISQFFNNLFGNSQTYTFTGNATSQTCTGSMTNGNWRYVNASDNNPEGMFSFSGMTVEVSTSQTATLAIQPYTEGDVEVSQITICGLDMKASEDQSYTILEIGEGSYFGEGCTLTYGGETYEPATLYIGKAQATPTAITLEMTIYFRGKNDGEDCSKAVNFTYIGQAETTE